MYGTMGSMSMLQTPTSSVRSGVVGADGDAGGSAQKKKGLKSSLGRFFRKKENVRNFLVFVNCLNV